MDGNTGNDGNPQEGFFFVYLFFPGRCYTLLTPGRLKPATFTLGVSVRDLKYLQRVWYGHQMLRLSLPLTICKYVGH